MLKLQGFKVGVYEGSMNDAARTRVKRQFNGGTLDMLIVTPAGATGWNLQKRSTGTIHFDLPWTYAEYVQREARNWRTGQKHAVDSYSLTHTDSVQDRNKLRIMLEKASVLRAVDELSRSTDASNPLALLSVRGLRPGLRTMGDYEIAVGQSRARRLVEELARKTGVLMDIDPALALSRNVPLASLIKDKGARNRLAWFKGR